MKSFRVFIIFYLVLVRVPGFAQNPGNLNECIQYAIKKNLSIKNQQLDQLIAKKEYKQTIKSQSPSINAYSSARFNFGRSYDENTISYVNESWFFNNYSIQTSVNLFNGFQTLNRIKIHKYLLEQSIASETMAKDELAFDVMSAYYDVIYFRELKDIVKEQVRISELELKSVKKRSELGLKAKSDILELSANLQNEQLNFLQAANNENEAIMRLKELLNYPISDSIELQKELFLVDVESSNAETDIEESLGNLPAIQLAETKMKVSKKQLSVQKGNLSPSISGFGGIGSSYSETKLSDGAIVPFNDQINNNMNQYVGLNFQIPIWRKGSALTNVSIAKINLEQSENDLEREKQETYYMISKEIQNLNTLISEFNKLKEQEGVNEHAFLVAQKKLDSGLINVVDFYVAKNRLAQSKVDILQAELQIIIKNKLLDYYKGSRFWEI